MDFEQLPRIRVPGQVQATYIVGETNTGLLLIDQHAADERINYERLQDRLDGERTTQRLAEPVELDITGREAAAFPAYAETLGEIGFHAERMSDQTLRVEAVPAVFSETLDPSLLQDVSLFGRLAELVWLQA